MILGAAQATRVSADWSPIPMQGLGIPFMLVGPILAAFCVVIYVVTSLLTPAMDPEGSRQGLLGSSAGVPQGPADGASDPRIVTLDPADGGRRALLPLLEIGTRS